MPVKLRFAPSPTGRLQVGNARVAIVNWLFARQQGGSFLLRLDDTDTARSEARYAEAIERDLGWLGLDWDESFRQSDRLARYAVAAERLKSSGRLYPCYETAEELEEKRRLQQARGRPPVYDRAARELGPEQRRRLEAEGRTPHWRFLLEREQIVWDDLVRGRQPIDAGSLSDPVLIRADGRPLYSLTSVVDDLECAITHVVRGEDHVANSAAQIQIFRALGGGPPIFAHLPLMLGGAGEKLSKRTAGLSLEELREATGIEAMALVSYLAKLGTPAAIEPRHSLAELVREFDISAYGRAAPRYDEATLLEVNARLLHETPFEAVAERLRALGLADADAAFWEAVRPNVTRLGDAAQWYRLCRGAVTPEIEDAAFLAEAAELLPEEPWDEITWGLWTDAVKAATGRQGRRLFMPLRKALTGLDQGPELKRLLPLIGRERARRRLLGERA